MEAKWQKQWERDNLYKWDSSDIRENAYVIDTPPPTVSGTLHIGHVYSYTQTDIIARYQRMKGKNVFYPIGFDDNGLPTERLVEKDNKIRARDLTREEFYDVCRKTIVKYEAKFEELFRSVGISFDWDEKYQTVSEQSIKLSQMSFVDLMHKGLVLREFAPTFWDSEDQTAIAQAEIEDRTQQGVMYYINFRLESGQEIEIATTRPELLPACVAVFYHPKDERYKFLQGKFAISPVFKAKVPMLEDKDVDPEKGTGLVMCCTYGDVQDVIWQQRHNLEIIQCINLYGKMINSGVLNDLKVKIAREKIVELLRAEDSLMAQKEVEQTVKCAERSGAVLELLPTHQWYVALLNHREELLKQVVKCKWYPQFIRKRAEIWIEGLKQNWCISRQRYFGVPFPVWYSKREGEVGKILLADVDQLPVNPLKDLPCGYAAHEVEPECDVMDTWATSAVSPALASLGINEKYAIDREKFRKLTPADLRPQSHEIIRTWAFYTICKSYYHNHSVPWHNVAISGWCLAHDRSKMSKSKGNTIDPTVQLQQYGADVVRYWASTSKLGVDTAFSEDVLKIGKKLTNKLWNAAQFANMHLQNMIGAFDTIASVITKGIISECLDLWIVTKLHDVVKESTDEMERLEYSNARSIIETFFWRDFCDYYLEMSKKRAYNAENNNDAGQQSVIYTLHYVLKTLLRLFAPFIPHICDEINETVYEGTVSINAKGQWPIVHDIKGNRDEIIADGDGAVNIIERVRKKKTDMSLALNAPIVELKYTGIKKLSDSLERDVLSAANAERICYGGGDIENKSATEYDVVLML